MASSKEVITRISLVLAGTFLPLFLINHILGMNEPKAEQTVKEYLAEQGYRPAYYPSSTRKHATKDIGFYPVSSLPNSLTFYCDEGYGLTTYKSDSFGFRNKDENWNSKSNENSTLILVGDSFVHGACLPEEATIGARVGESTESNVINLGFGGNTPYEYIATLKSVVAPLVKDNTSSRITVILFFYINDLVADDKNRLTASLASNAIVEKSRLDANRFTASKEYVQKLKSLIYEHFPSEKDLILTELRTKNSSIKTNPLYKTFSLYYIRTYLKSVFLKKECSQILNCINPSLKAIDVLNSICTEKCKPIIAYIPRGSAWGARKDSETYNSLLRKYAHNSKNKYIDGNQSINWLDSSHYMPSGPHLSIKGARKLANQITKSIPIAD